MSDYTEILNTPMQRNDADADTIGAYLAALLTGVWNETEGFNGKRPFGNSSWEWEVYNALVKAGHVAGTFDHFDELNDDFDQDAADVLIRHTINHALGATS